MHKWQQSIEGVVPGVYFEGMVHLLHTSCCSYSNEHAFQVFGKSLFAHV